MFKYVARCYSVLQCVVEVYWGVGSFQVLKLLQCASVCCSVLHCAARCCSVLQGVAVCWSVLQRCTGASGLFKYFRVYFFGVVVSCGVLQCVAVCFIMLQWVSSSTTHSSLPHVNESCRVC